MEQIAILYKLVAALQALLVIIQAHPELSDKVSFDLEDNNSQVVLVADLNLDLSKPLSDLPDDSHEGDEETVSEETDEPGVVASIACETPSLTFDESNYDHVYDGIEVTDTVKLVGSEWNNTLIKNCHVHDTDGDGILLRDIENVVITDCLFENIGGQAAVRGSIGGGTNNVVLYNNKVRNTTENGFTFGQRFADGVDHRNLKIIGNTIENTGLNENQGFAHGMYIQAQDFEITNNTISGTRDGNGISVRSSGAVVCNSVTGSSKADKPGIRYYSDHQTGASETLVFERNIVAGQVVGIDVLKPAERYDGQTGIDHVVKTFVFSENEVTDNQLPIRVASTYSQPPFKVITQ